jgi:hypothetical protein
MMAAKVFLSAQRSISAGECYALRSRMPTAIGPAVYSRSDHAAPLAWGPATLRGLWESFPVGWQCSCLTLYSKEGHRSVA